MSALLQIVTGLAVLLISGAATYVVKVVTKLPQKIDALTNVIVTPQPTPLVPNPPQGLIEVTTSHTATIATMAARQDEQNGKVDKIKTMVEGLVQAGVATKSDVAVAATMVAEAAQVRQDAILGAIHDQK